MKTNYINKCFDLFFIQIYKLKITLNAIIRNTVASYFWLSFIILIPMLIPLFVFTQITEVNNADHYPYVIFLFTGYLTFSVSFSAFNFTSRSLYLYRKKYLLNTNNPLEVFENFFKINLVYFFVNILLVYISLKFYNIFISNFSIKIFSLALISSYLFGKALTLLFAVFIVLFRDFRFLGRIIVGILYLGSSIPYTYKGENYFLMIFTKYNPLSVFAESFRYSLFLNHNVFNLNLLYIYCLLSFIFYFLILIFFKKKIYQIYSI